MPNQLRLSPQLRYDAAARTVEGVLIPYGVIAIALDANTGRQVRERIMPGALAIPEAMALSLMHLDGHTAALAVQLTDTPQALQMRAVLDGPDADLAIRMLERGSLTGFSAEFLDGDRQTVGGVSEVRKAALVGASLVDRPAYASARAQLREATGPRVNVLGGVWL